MDSGCLGLNVLCPSDAVVTTYQTTYLLTYSMVQNPWEANWFAASQEIPRISWNPKVLYRTHKRPPPVSILGQPNPAHIPTSHLLEIHLNIIHPSTPRSSQWSPSLRFPHQDPIYPLSSPIRATCPAHLITVPITLLIIPFSTLYFCALRTTGNSIFVVTGANLRPWLQFIELNLQVFRQSSNLSSFLLQNWNEYKHRVKWGTK